MSPREPVGRPTCSLCGFPNWPVVFWERGELRSLENYNVCIAKKECCLVLLLQIKSHRMTRKCFILGDLFLLLLLLFLEMFLLWIGLLGRQHVLYFVSKWIGVCCRLINIFLEWYLFMEFIFLVLNLNVPISKVTAESGCWAKF